jgi:hypothetical protein
MIPSFRYLVRLKKVKKKKLNGYFTVFKCETNDSNTLSFKIWSHGYEYPPDLLGLSGARIQISEGGNVTLKIHRINIAERLYRVTGEGIYADSLMVGYPIPPNFLYPFINCQVTGQDSVTTSIYENKTYWFWGDTLGITYALGNFGTTGATTDTFIGRVVCVCYCFCIAFFCYSFF